MWNNSGYLSLVFPLFLVLSAWYLLRKRSKNALPFPPGPVQYPIIGNLLDFPLGVPLWEGLTDLSKQHGKVPSSPGLLESKLPLLNVDTLESQKPMSFV